MCLGFLINEKNVTKVREILADCDNADIIYLIAECEKLIDNDVFCKTRFLDDIISLYDLSRDECCRRVALNCNENLHQFSCFSVRDLQQLEVPSFVVDYLNSFKQ